MKSFVLLTVVLVLVAISVTEGAKNVKKCKMDCTTAEFDPICAAEGNQESKSFGSKCVMELHNCEHNSKHFKCCTVCFELTQKSKGECPTKPGEPKKGIRLF